MLEMILPLLMLMILLPETYSQSSETTRIEYGRFWQFQLYNGSSHSWISLPKVPLFGDNIGPYLISMSYQTNASFDSDDRHLLLNGSLASWLTLWRTWANFKPSVTQDFPPVGSKDLTYRNFSSDHDCFALRQALVDDERIENLSKDGIVSNFSNQEAVDIDTELNKSNLPPTLDCPIKLFDTAVYSPTNVDCSLKADNWVHTDADSNLATFVRGGVSTEGEFFTGLEPNKSLATELRTIMSVTGGLRCSLKNPCGPPQACTDLGVRYTYSPPGALHTSKFGYLALWAIRNINQQLNNQYVAIKGAAIRGTLDTFNVDTYLPKPSKPTGLLDALNGIGAIVAVISGFLPPVAGAITGAVGAIVPAAGAVFERSISDNVKKYGPLAAQKEFAPILRRIYEDFVETLDTVTTDLFDGKKINNQTTILDMMSGGHWVDPDTLTDVSDAEDQIYTEIFSRAINGLWKIPTSNKIWVLYLDTGDRKNSIDKCEAHTAGPQDLKYCADGGVYYAYNFIEDGDYKGHLGYPWGADQMDLNTHINPAVSP